MTASEVAVFPEELQHDERAELTLRWLVGLRWGAVSGQAAALAFAIWVLHAQIPVVPFLAVLLLTVATNLGVLVLIGPRRQASQKMAGALLTLDTVSLTILLQLSGGASNPFSTLYLVHVTLAAVVLGSRWAWILTGLAVTCYAALFVWYVPVPQLEHLAHQAASASLFQLTHLQAMWVALTVSAILTVTFVVRLASALERQRGEVAAMRERALKAERLAAVTTLAAGAAHELGSPLGTIAVAASELERSLADADASDLPSLAQDARLICVEVDRCRGVLDRISAEGGEIAGEAVFPVAVHDVVAEAVASLPAVDAARVDTPPGSAVRAAAPRRALARALRDIVRNALDASPPAGRVSVRLDEAQGIVRIVTLDDGPGIAPEVLVRAGEPFFSTKSPGQGLGLGLFLARSLAESLGGRLHLVPRPEGGTAVTFELPVHPSKV